MKGPFKIYLNDTPVTRPIEDEKRAGLAYNVLYTIGETRATINDKVIDVDKLSIMDANGESFVADLDPEWYESYKTQIKDSNYHDTVIKHVIEEAAKNGEIIDPRDAEMQMTCYIVQPADEHYDDETDNFLPITWDKNKAIEMFNFLKYGMDPSVELAFLHRDVEPIDRGWFSVSADELQLIDLDNNVITDVSEPDWIKGKISPDIIGINDEDNFAATVADDFVASVANDFTAAIAEISEEEPKLEQ